MIQPNAPQIQRFATIGLVGFAVDAGLLTLLNSIFRLELFESRMTSFFVAVTVTWWLNRNWTFSESQDKQKTKEWGRYAIVNTVGAAINMGIFFWLIRNYALMAEFPLAPLSIAAAVALVFNYSASKHIAFKPRQS